ncbi:MAG: PfkB family carbohydrate kinase, partial [Verrucomicrobiota bacterium]
IVEEVSKQLTNVDAPIVVDPVAVASTGDDLTQSGFAEVLDDFIRERATLVTPNRGEAQQLLGESIAEGWWAAAQLADMLDCAVLLKGGHFEGEESIDWLAAYGGLDAIRSPRIEGLDVHGTGCAYSAAIAAQLAAGERLHNAVLKARSYLHEALVNHYQWGELKALANPANPAQIGECPDS